MPKEELRRKEILGRTAKYKVVKNYRPNLRPLKIILYLGILFFIFYGIFLSEYFKIKNIEVQGVKSVEVNDYLHKTLIGKNILFFLPGQYLNELTHNYPILSEAEIVRGLPSTILIIATEKDQVLTWCAQSCFNIDNYGYAYEIAKPSQNQVNLNDKSKIDIKIGDKVATPDFINFYLTSLEKVREMGIKIIEAKIEETSFKLVFKTSDQYEIIFDTSESITNQLSALRQVLEKNKSDIKQYADLRVEGLVYLK